MQRPFSIASDGVNGNACLAIPASNASLTAFATCSTRARVLRQRMHQKTRFEERPYLGIVYRGLPRAVRDPDATPNVNELESDTQGSVHGCHRIHEDRDCLELAHWLQWEVEA